MAGLTAAAELEDSARVRTKAVSLDDDMAPPGGTTCNDVVVE